MRMRALLAAVLAALCLPVSADEASPSPVSGAAKVMVIPLRAQIAKPELFILRRGLKEAIDQGAGTVVLDMRTPGGSAAITLEMMEALDRFEGKKITYVNNEAGSAGAILAAVTDEIHFAPAGVIGAAELIMGTGQDVPEGMKRKWNSYLSAKIRSLSDEVPGRANVIKAMMDPEFELKIGDEIIKPKGELLTLTATEAMKEYGDPPMPLLGSGIHPSVENLLDSLHGPGGWSMTRVEVTWSERVAQYLTAWSPLLMAAGMVLLFIEFKTPGFGIFGIGGGLLLALVFFGHHAAGLSGHEPALFFLLGVILLAVELFLLPGTFVFAVLGGLLMLGSLVWSMADLWPEEPLNISADVFLWPVVNVFAGVVLAVGIFLALLKVLPKGGRWGKMVLETAVAGVPAAALESAPSLLGQTGVAVTDLFPSGQIEIDGRRYDARLPVGTAGRGAPVRVTGGGEFELIVEVILS